MLSRRDKIAQQRYLAKLDLVRSGATDNPNQTAEEKEAVLERCKRDVVFCAETFFPHYCSSPSADFHAEFAGKVSRNPLIRAFAQWGRGHAKSVWVNIIIPFWLWLRGEPMYLVIIGSNYDKAKMLLGDLQAEFEANPRIDYYCGPQKRQGSWEDGLFVTNGGFIGQCLGAGQNVRGLRMASQRPTCVVCDDVETKQLVKNPQRQDEFTHWIETALIPTMDGEYRRFLYACNRFAPVMIQTKLQERHPKWWVHQVNAYDPVTYEPRWHQKYGPDYFKGMEIDLGILACKAEYNNDPHIEGKIFRNDQIQWAKVPRIDHFEFLVGHWDVAYSANGNSDYNAVRLWGLKERNFYLIDCYVKRSKMAGAIAWMCDKQLELEALKSEVHIHWQYESQFWNDELERTIREVEKEYGMELPIISADRPKGNKYDRILSTQVYYQNNRIYYNERLKSHNDTQEGIAQLLGIEPGYKTKDDAPDADEAALKRLSMEVAEGSRGGASYGNKYTNTGY